MPCSTPCENFTHRAGRCLCGTNASRACFGMTPLEDEDTPLSTPEDAAEDALIFWAALTIVVVAFAIPMVLAAIDYFR